MKLIIFQLHWKNNGEQKLEPKAPNNINIKCLGSTEKEKNLNARILENPGST